MCSNHIAATKEKARILSGLSFFLHILLPSPVALQWDLQTFGGDAAGGIAGEAIMVAGYFVYEAAALKLGMGAAAGVLANVGQGAVGLVIALVLMALLKGSKALDKLAVQW